MPTRPNPARVGHPHIFGVRITWATRLLPDELLEPLDDPEEEPLTPELRAPVVPEDGPPADGPPRKKVCDPSVSVTTRYA